MKKGKFSGNVKAEWLDDGRKMRLLETITFTDSKGKVWTSEKGRVINGADIPRFFWRVAGSPYVGLHRRPSVLHDIQCEDRTESYKNVHRMFYEAMLAEGMDKHEAKQKYIAVKNFGPKWDKHGNDLVAETDCDEQML